MCIFIYVNTYLHTFRYTCTQVKIDTFFLGGGTWAHTPPTYKHIDTHIRRSIFFPFFFKTAKTMDSCMSIVAMHPISHQKILSKCTTWTRALRDPFICSFIHFKKKSGCWINLKKMKHIHHLHKNADHHRVADRSCSLVLSRRIREPWEF